MSQEKILELIEKISPHAKDFVYNAFENKDVDILYSILTEQNKGIFIKADSKECCIFFASFLNEDNIDTVLNVIENTIKEFLSKPNSKEICFNVYGKNTKIINLVRTLGFKLDMEGYHLEFRGNELSKFNESNLIDKDYSSSMIDEFIELFDSAYYQLCINSGWKTNSYAQKKEQFNQDLENLNSCNQARSFWLNNELVGAYIFENNYITDIVVKQSFQNKGYGSYLLAHCLRNMIVNKSIKNIRLRVSKSNVDAKRFYERNNFVEISCFAEHTYY